MYMSELLHCLKKVILKKNLLFIILPLCNIHSIYMVRIICKLLPLYPFSLQGPNSLQEVV